MKEIYREYISGQVNEQKRNFNPKVKQLVARLMKLVPSKGGLGKTSFDTGYVSKKKQVSNKSKR